MARRKRPTIHMSAVGTIPPVPAWSSGTPNSTAIRYSSVRISGDSNSSSMTCLGDFTAKCAPTPMSPNMSARRAACPSSMPSMGGL